MSKKLSEKQLAALPRGYNGVGEIMILRLKPELMVARKQIGAAALKVLPHFRTVALEKGISGTTRKPRMEVLAGKSSLETIHREHGCVFKMDLNKVMWSGGNKGERGRLAGMIKPNEKIVDMFAGIGYWTLPVAKKAKQVTAIDVNPTALAFLKENLKLNRLSHKVTVLRGDCRNLSDDLAGTADRVISGWLDDSLVFFPSALKIAKKGATIHYHEALPLDQVEARTEELKDVASAYGRTLKVLDIQHVKSMSPGKQHLVFDLKVC
ncbi:MAG: class I SAM-dependent methyltransferase family protein [Candidatus Aenigmatarchaeota archaeon]